MLNEDYVWIDRSNINAVITALAEIRDVSLVKDRILISAEFRELLKEILTYRESGVVNWEAPLMEVIVDDMEEVEGDIPEDISLGKAQAEEVKAFYKELMNGKIFNREVALDITRRTLHLLLG